MPFLVFNRNRSRREVRALERIATALEDIRDFVKPVPAMDDSFVITSVEKASKGRDEDEDEMPTSARMG